MNEEIIKSIIVIARLYSVDLTIFDEAFLVKSIDRRLMVTGIRNFVDYCDFIKENSYEAETFFRSLHISYSRFFREPFSFSILEQMIIPNIIRKATVGSEIRVWTAGCAYGQEAYSLAMLLNEQIETAHKELRYRIFATDITRNALAFAEEGVYDAADVQNVKLKFIKAYFAVNGDTFSIVPSLKQNITFSYYDVLESNSANPPESIFGGFDLVCCCNLLMYYKPIIRLSILNKLKNSISKTGFLIVGGAERAFVKSNTDFQTLSIPTAVFQKRDSSPESKLVQLHC